MQKKIVYFEIPASDPNKLSGFYSDLFEWKFEKMPGEQEYWMIHTGDDGESLTGGMMPRMDPMQKPINYVDVESVDEYAEKVRKLGGQVILEKRPVPGMGWFAVCQDPDGNPFALWQTDEKAA